MPASPSATLRASQLADDVMTALGGRTAWEQVPILAFTVDATRRLVWDRWSGNVRIDNLLDDQTVLFNLNTSLGRVYRNGDELLQPDSVARYVRQAKQLWFNDSFGLALPFTLKDKGVVLAVQGSETTQLGKPADVLQVTFRNGLPRAGTRYKLWIDKKTHLITQWAFFPTLTATQPSFTLPWSGYQQYGNLTLASKRGDRDLTDLMVFTGLPGEVFSDFTRTDLRRYQQIR